MVYNGYLDAFFRGDSNDTQGVPYLCGLNYPSDFWCFEGSGPSSTGPGQAVVFKNRVYYAYAYSANHQLVVCYSSSYDGLSMICSLIPGIYVADTPAIGVTPDGNELDIAYQEASSAHYLGLAYSTDGYNFTNTMSSVYRIGHTPGMTTFNGQEYIVAFCQCDSHYLDVYTSTGQGQLTFLTEDRGITISNASPPSIVVANGVLVLGYIQNGSRYFQISTSYDGINWTSPVYQSNINAVEPPWGGPALAVYQNELWLFYNPQGLALGPRQLSYATAPLPY